MTLEKQITSLELSKKLKELGYPQEGLFWWTVNQVGFTCITGKMQWSERLVTTEQKNNIPETVTNNSNLLYIAPTVAELGEWLPEGFEQVKSEDGLWTCYDDLANKSIKAETEADARAKMLIWLVENEYVSFKGEDHGT